jgi:hypothetical protein
MSALAVCIVAGALTVALPARAFTLAWQHTVEKVMWEEDYLIAGDWLYLTGARVRGSGAGMEPPAGAIRMDGTWRYQPSLRWLREITLARSEFGVDYTICIAQRCRPLSELIGPPKGAVKILPCRR